MEIISTKMGYDSDHSSTNYRFFTAEDEVPEDVKLFLKETGESFKIWNNTIRFKYYWGYIPDRIEKTLLTDYNIPVMIYEDYDWWRIYLVFDFDKVLFKKIKVYECPYENYYIYAKEKDGKIVLQIGVVLNYDALYQVGGSDTFPALYGIFSKVRNNILNGNLTELELINMYCEGDDGFYSEQPETKTGKILTRILGKR